MELFVTLLTTILLSLAVAADPISVKRPLVTLPLSRRINVDSSVRNILEHDQLRAQALKSQGSTKAAGVTRQVSTPTTNEAVSYVAAVGVGSPATIYELIVDSGSSSTCIAGYTGKSTLTTRTGHTVRVSDGLGSCPESGTQYIVTLTIEPNLVVTDQSITASSNSSSSILGLGPTCGIPTVTDNLFAEHKIPADLVSVSFEPLTTDPETNGLLTWGGINSARFTGSITYTGITTTSPASAYWGINQSITYGSTTILSTTAGIVDTGTTLILIASNAFSKYESATGAVLDSATGLLRVTTTQYNNLRTLNFIIGGTTFGLTPNGQIWPRFLNTDIGGTSSSIYLIVGNLGTPSGEGLDFINGQTFVERFYCVFDTGNHRVGVATTPFTTATTN